MEHILHSCVDEDRNVIEIIGYPFHVVSVFADEVSVKEEVIVGESVEE